MLELNVTQRNKQCLLKAAVMRACPCSTCNANCGGPKRWPPAQACKSVEPATNDADQMQQAFVLLVVCVDRARLAQWQPEVDTWIVTTAERVMANLLTACHCLTLACRLTVVPRNRVNLVC